eukprot:SAG11_NODE_31761_length_289_cov_1.078947_1_plen_32_part_01
MFSSHSQATFLHLLQLLQSADYDADAELAAEN